MNITYKCIKCGEENSVSIEREPELLMEMVTEKPRKKEPEVYVFTCDNCGTQNTVEV